MSQQPQFHVVSAISQATRETVYLTGCDEWSAEILQAEFIDDAEHADFRLFVASRQTRLVSAPALTPVQITDHGPVPLSNHIAAE
ncbi:DUF2849 domain-containing protein [Marimonas lutisalis]|uniref:DUF2849 domain-containing protein n=1 Tax=Marimonas lutisalis TaxID=2545756 RepID=UPI00137565A1|nr:DUF2849 domain-containing protein [Marimonas lutisalis]